MVTALKWARRYSETTIVSQTLAQRFVGALLIICLLTGCAGIDRPRSAPQSTNARVETTSHSTLESTTIYGAFQGDSPVDARHEGPKTERAVGIVALAGFALVITFFVMVVYRVVQLLN